MTRPRRLRRTPALRGLARETHLTPDVLIVPHFILPGSGQREAIPSMPGIERWSADIAVKESEADLARGLRAALLFGLPIPESKDAEGRAAADPEGPVPRAIRALKEQHGDALTVIADVCLCAYTTHGHCGVLDGHGHVANDASLDRLAAAAVTYADAGADVIAPSDMMDGRVHAIRDALDAAGHEDVLILSYSAKYASAYYGPFRDAAKSAPGTGDRKSYQMDPANVREAIRECLLDEQEGADALMVKPALAYLDVIRAVREHTALPLAAYNTSGEYGMVKAAAANGWIDEAAVVRENLLAMRRAGADWIITYHARDAVDKGWLE